MINLFQQIAVSTQETLRFYYELNFFGKSLFSSDDEFDPIKKLNHSNHQEMQDNQYDSHGSGFLGDNIPFINDNGEEEVKNISEYMEDFPTAQAEKSFAIYSWKVQQEIEESSEFKIEEESIVEHNERFLFITVQNEESETSNEESETSNEEPEEEEIIENEDWRKYWEKQNIRYFIENSKYGADYLKLKDENMELIVNGNRNQKDKRGRPKGIRLWSIETLRRKIVTSLNGLPEKKQRIDAEASSIGRIIKKIPDFLLKTMCSRAEYKSPKLSEYIVMYLITFLEGFVKVFDVPEPQQTIELFAHFIALRFPREKVEKVINILIGAQLLPSKHGLEIIKFMDGRAKHSKSEFQNQYEKNLAFKFIINNSDTYYSELKDSIKMKFTRLHDKLSIS